MSSENFHRESLIALKATRQAMKIARDVMYQPVDVHQMTCDACGAPIDWKRAIADFQMYCPYCGKLQTVPCHLRPEVDDMYKEILRGEYELQQAKLQYQRALESRLASVPPAVNDDRSIPWHLQVFFYFCLAFAVLAIFSVLRFFPR